MTDQTPPESVPPLTGMPSVVRDSFDSPDGRTYSEPLNAVTPGQRAYDGIKAWRAERDPMMLVTDWTHPAVTHEGWEAAAQAVLNDAFPRLRAQIAELRADRDDYAARLKAVDASWTVLAAERDELAQQLDKLRNLIDDFTHAVIDLDTHYAIVKAAHAVREKAGLPSIDPTSKPAGQ